MFTPVSRFHKTIKGLYYRGFTTTIDLSKTTLDDKVKILKIFNDNNKSLLSLLYRFINKNISFTQLVIYTTINDRKPFFIKIPIFPFVTEINHIRVSYVTNRHMYTSYIKYFTIFNNIIYTDEYISIDNKPYIKTTKVIDNIKHPNYTESMVENVTILEALTNHKR